MQRRHQQGLYLFRYAIRWHCHRQEDSFPGGHKLCSVSLPTKLTVVMGFASVVFVHGTHQNSLLTVLVRSSETDTIIRCVRSKLAKGIIVTCLPVITLVLGILFEKS